MLSVSTEPYFVGKKESENRTRLPLPGDQQVVPGQEHDVSPASQGHLSHNHRRIASGAV